MGSRMVRHLISEEIELTIWNRSASGTEAFKADGLQIADSVSECVQGADIVFTMLSTPEAVKEVAFGENGFVAAMKAGSIWVDCTTVNPSFSREMGVLSDESGIKFIDAPVAGSTVPAEKGELVFLAGTNAEGLEKVQPYLDLMGKKTIPCGSVGQGSALKTLINALLGQSMAVFAETVALGKALNFQEEFLLNLLPALPVTAPFIAMKKETLGEEAPEAQFPLEWMLKDLVLAAKTAEEVDTPVRLISETRDLFSEAAKAGRERQDFSALYQNMNRK